MPEISPEWQTIIDWSEITGPFPGDVIGPTLEHRRTRSRTTTVIYEVRSAYPVRGRHNFLVYVVAPVVLAALILAALILVQFA